MLRFQQAYQASAQIIQVANSLFDTLINAVRR
jgi:flagellar hook-associated protein 1 FlgK